MDRGGNVDFAIVTGSGKLAEKVSAAAKELAGPYVHYTIRLPRGALADFARPFFESFRQANNAIDINPFSFVEIEQELRRRGIKRIFFGCDLPSLGWTPRLNSLGFAKFADEKCMSRVQATPEHLLPTLRYLLALNELLSSLDVEPLLACEIFPQFNLSPGTASVREPPAEILDRLPEVLITLGRQWELAAAERSRSTQPVIVDRGIVMQSEDGTVIGTNAVLKRYGARSITRDVPYLLKPPSVQFNPAIDQPTIGFETVQLCKAAGVQGIIICAETTTVIDKAEIIRQIDEYGMFLYAVPLIQMREIYVQHFPQTWIQLAPRAPWLR